MRKLSKWKKKIEKLTPVIDVDSLAVNDSGIHNTIVTVNHEWIYRFPKYSEEAERIAKEYHLLRALGQYISLPVPYPEYSNLEGESVSDIYIAYRLIPGKPLFRQSFLQIDNHERLAAQLGTFLKELHSIPIDNFVSLDIETVDSRMKWLGFYNEMKKKLYPSMRQDARERIDRVFDMFLNDPSNFTFKKTLVHGDLGPTNILHVGDNISGIIDFSEAGIDDPAVDIASLMGDLGYGEGFIDLLSETYPDAANYINRARFYRSTFVLQDALLGYDMNNRELFDTCMQAYK